MSSVEGENVTSSVNATPFTYLFQRHPVPSSVAWWPCLVCLASLPPFYTQRWTSRSLVCLALVSVVVNVLTCVVLATERSLQTTLYAYLTSLSVADVIGSSLVTPIMAARTSLGQSLRISSIGVGPSQIVSK